MTDPEFRKMLPIGSVQFGAADGSAVVLRIVAVNDGTVLMQLCPEPANGRESGLALTFSPTDGFALAKLVTLAAAAAADAIGDGGCSNCGERHDVPQLPLDLPEDFAAAVQAMLDAEAGDHD